MATKALSDLDPSLKSPLLQQQADPSSALPLKTNQVTQTAFRKFIDFMKSLGGRPILDHVYFAGDNLGALKTAQNIAVTAGIAGSTGFDQVPANIASGGLLAAAGIGDIARATGVVEKAHRIGDEVGLFGGVLRGLFRGPMELVRGASTVATNALTMTGKSSSMPQVVMGLSYATFAGGYICSTVIGATAIYNFVEAKNISNALDKKVTEGNIAAFDHLKEMLIITKEDEDIVLKEIFNPKSKSLHQRVMTRIAGAIFTKESKADTELKKALQTQNIADIVLPEAHVDIEAPLTPEEEKVSIELAKKEGFSTLDPATARKLIHLVAKLYTTGIERQKEKKETVFSRTIGSKTKALVGEAIKADVIPPTDKLKEIITSAKEGLSGHKKRMMLITLACILTTAVNILTEAATGGIYSLVELGLGAVISLIWLGIDGYYLYQAYKESHADWKDRALMLLVTFSVVVVGALATSFARSKLGSALLTAVMLSMYLAVSIYEIAKFKNAQEASKKSQEPDSAYASQVVK